MSVVMTYTSLFNQILKWNERINDALLADQIPTVISQTEFMLARELKTLLFQKAVTGSFTIGMAGAVLPKPARWREMSTFFMGTGSGYMKTVELYPREYSYCRQFAPNPETLGTPTYYCDYQYTYFLVVSSPDQAYPYEMKYYESPPPLGPQQQTNQLTQYVPDLMFKGCQLTAAMYLENLDMIPVHQGIYDRALASTKSEGISRLQDGGQNASQDN